MKELQNTDSIQEGGVRETQRPLERAGGEQKGRELGPLAHQQPPNAALLSNRAT